MNLFPFKTLILLIGRYYRFSGSRITIASLLVALVKIDNKFSSPPVPLAKWVDLTRWRGISRIKCRLAGLFVKMPRARIAVIDKERLLRAHQRGDDYFTLADNLGIKRRTAYAIIRRAEGWNRVVELPRGGRSRHVKVDDDMQHALQVIIDENPAFTLNQINAALRECLKNRTQAALCWPILWKQHYWL